MIPFLVDMSRLFELFIAEWMKINTPSDYEIRPQERVEISEDGIVYFNIDLVLYDKMNNNSACCVLDSKYKRHENPLPTDIAKVGIYAVAKNCKLGVLIYPTNKVNHINSYIGSSNIKVCSLSFSLEEDIDIAGKKFLQNLSLIIQSTKQQSFT